MHEATGSNYKQAPEQAPENGDEHTNSGVSTDNKGSDSPFLPSCWHSALPPVSEDHNEISDTTAFCWKDGRQDSLIIDSWSSGVPTTSR
jgi:hypothetical protein